MIIKKNNNSKDNNKENRLLDTAFKLFTEKGIKDTSISDIASNADIGKGTFYLYFKDKYEIRDILIEKKSKILFNNALKDLRKNDINGIQNQIIFIIDHVIDALKKDQLLLKFIAKNLSWGVFSKTVNKIYEKEENEENSIYNLFIKGLNEANITLQNPYVTLYMIIELLSSTAFNSILYNEPLPIEEYKLFLHQAILKLLEI